MNRTVVAVLASSALVSTFALAGCGGDSNEASDESASPSASAEADSSPSAGDGSGAPDAANAPGADTAYCELVSGDFVRAFGSVQTPEDAKKAIGMMKDVAEAAPAEVQDAWERVSAALGKVQSALQDAAELQQRVEDGTLSKQQMAKETAKLMQRMEALDTPENNRAGEAISKHAKEYCGVTLGSSGSS
jgi:hypothetical protein